MGPDGAREDDSDQPAARTRNRGPVLHSSASDTLGDIEMTTVRRCKDQPSNAVLCGP